MMAKPLSVSVSRSGAREGGLVICVRYAYQDRPATPKQRTAMALEMLRESLVCLEKGRPTDLGFSEDSVRRVRTDRLGT